VNRQDYDYVNRCLSICLCYLVHLELFHNAFWLMKGVVVVFLFGITKQANYSLCAVGSLNEFKYDVA
jgi:hypothetical protein